MDSTNYEYVPYVQTFQKADSIGHTDREQRKADLYACGVDRGQNLDNGNWGRGGSDPKATLQQSVAYAEKLEHCMETKGYVVFGFDECGPLKAPTGKCN